MSTSLYRCYDNRVPDGTAFVEATVPTGTESREKRVEAKPSNTRQESIEELAVKQSVLDAAFSAFMEGVYAETSTLQIASRARASKRALYALVGNKQERRAALLREPAP